MPQVGGVYPPNFNASITGQVVAGDGHVVFGAPGVQFGTVHAVNIYSAGGVPSAQGFGTPTVRATITRAVGSVASAQSFGVPTVRVVFLRTVNGVTSAQQFGAVTAKAGAAAVPVSGVPSAQSFGALTVKTKITVPVSGVPPSVVGGVAGPPATGMTVWLDASKLGLAEGDPVTAWPNLAPGGVNPSIVGTPAPTLKTGVSISGLPVVRFRMNEGRVRGDNGISASGLPNPTYNFTVVYVTRLWQGNVGRSFTAVYPGANYLVGFHSTAQDCCYDGGWISAGVAWTPAPGPWKLYGAASNHDGVNYRSRFYVDGVQTGGTAASGAGMSTRFALSGYDETGLQETMDAEVAELLVYNRELSDLERKAVEDYLRAKWLGGPPVGGPGGGQFGTVNVATVIRQTPAGLGSAQQFGTVAPRSAITRTVGAVASAQTFGTVTTSKRITVLASGVASAQSFGTVRANVRLATGGVSTAQQFGVPRANYRLTQTGVASAQAFGVPAVSLTTAVQLTGVVSAQSFGAIRTRFTVTVGSVLSAQQFGVLKTAYRVRIGAVSSAQLFGVPDAFRVYLHTETCLDEALDPLECLDVADAPICGEHITGEIIAGRVIVVGGTVRFLNSIPVPVELSLNGSAGLDISLPEAPAHEIDLIPS